jgi:hypothetical protein
MLTRAAPLLQTRTSSEEGYHSCPRSVHAPDQFMCGAVPAALCERPSRASNRATIASTAAALVGTRKCLDTQDRWRTGRLNSCQRRKPDRFTAIYELDQCRHIGRHHVDGVESRQFTGRRLCCQRLRFRRLRFRRLRFRRLRFRRLRFRRLRFRRLRFRRLRRKWSHRRGGR